MQDDEDARVPHGRRVARHGEGRERVARAAVTERWLGDL